MTQLIHTFCPIHPPLFPPVLVIGSLAAPLEVILLSCSVNAVWRLAFYFTSLTRDWKSWRWESPAVCCPQIVNIFQKALTKHHLFRQAFQPAPPPSPFPKGFSKLITSHGESYRNDEIHRNGCEWTRIWQNKREFKCSWQKSTSAKSWLN